MRRTVILSSLVLGSVAAVIVSCANGLIAPIPGDDAGSDVTTPPNDAGKDTGPATCNPACTPPAVCSNGVCKTTCDPPLVKCIGDSGTCVDLATDKANCGTCGTVCPTGDAGSMPPGPNNPDAGIFGDAGYDGGPGWALGTPTCAAKACGTTCPQGMTGCPDSICYDTQNHHDHCGTCGTACADNTEWCTGGKCCALGQANCNGTCTDVLTNPNNCGGCGKTCSGQTPFCTGGVCTGGQTFTASFTQSVASTSCTQWNTFRASLTGTYSSITISGTNDVVGRTCTGASADQLCKALKNGTTVSGISCGGFTWYVGANCAGSVELGADTSPCTCTNPGYSVRPCLSSNGDWGGVKTNTCGAPSQSITVRCQ